MKKPRKVSHENKVYRTILDKDLVFETSESLQVSTKISYTKGDVTDYLPPEIRELKLKVQAFESRRTITEDSLASFWDNEYDEAWNEC
ncbi:hypothetical protein MSMTP_1485 [Methanosarcina sp. MTP4]|uniref:hypothetical protein n=1 Tax=Methanosarcina sp. MTP4 TaxID=1434100 RepID=UPI000615ACAD|nr:hypothetical protein [Methanosarcina sp. MTP4]AKB24954.1 hypothetical protein MSMTP_1485 [Methanosarcina sp. MTP4]